MDNVTCQWDGCDRPVEKRGHCARCYKRARKAGTLELGPRHGRCADCGRGVVGGKTGPIPTRCRACAEQRRRTRMYAEWRQASSEKYEAERRWVACPDCGTERERSPRDTKSTRCLPCQAARRAALLKEWAKANPAKTYASKRKWHESNREVLRANNHRRRVLARSAQSDRFVARDIFERDGWACQICGVALDSTIKFPDPLSPSLDHIVPISRGGTHTLDNVQAACMGCNWAKGPRMT